MSAFDAIAIAGMAAGIRVAPKGYALFIIGIALTTFAVRLVAAL